MQAVSSSQVVSHCGIAHTSPQRSLSPLPVRNRYRNAGGECASQADCRQSRQPHRWLRCACKWNVHV